jgi:pyrroline-5-carboxylate reductase
MKQPDPVAFIGGGNMARSFIAGLLADGADAGSIRVAEPIAVLRDALHRDFGVQVFADNRDAVAGAGCWVLAAKPQVLHAVCETLADLAQSTRPLIVSIAAGVTTQQLDHWLGGMVAIVRAMPNLPALLGAGVAGVYASPQVDAAGCRRAERLLAAAGHVVWITDEGKMDAVTAVSGSGPAYVFLLAESMLAAAQSQGLPSDAARVLVLQTVLGAARMLIEEDGEPGDLRRRVTSPGGTTQAAMDVLQDGDFDALVARAIRAAAERGRALSAIGESAT